MSESLDISKLDQVAVRIHDLPRAVAFYKNVLNLPHMFTAGDKLAFFDCNGTRLMLSKPEKPEFDHAGSILYFKVADIQKAHAQLVGKGVKVEDPPHPIAKMGKYDLWMTFFRDSEDNLLALTCDVPAEG